ncbi:MAG: FliG C-terminal domain-containing protein [Planctomycetota bacterium]|jgi:flagellar motor switch protein FliG
MALTGRQKAAFLLMSLDTAAAADLLRGLAPEDVQDIAIELARIDASEQHDVKQQAKVVREFCNALQQRHTQKFSVRTFLNEMLVTILDKDRADQIQSEIRETIEKKDLFGDIRQANTDELVLALEGEHPQTIAVVLSELAPKKSQEVLALLEEEARLKAVCKMTNPELVGNRVRQQIASTIIKRLKSLKGQTLVEKPEQTLRKLAIVLSGLEKELRDQLLDEIAKQDEETATMVRRLMITWEDIPSVANRSLQEALRTVDSNKLAIALHGADEDVVQIIRSNISERAMATLDEEISLMQEPLEKEVLDAREEVVKPLREANEEGTLRVTGR